MEAESGISRTSLHRILTNVLQKRKISVRWLPHFLSTEEKAVCMRIAQDLLMRYRNKDESFLECIIELKSQSNVWAGKGEKLSQKVRRQQSKVKQMVVLAYDWSSVFASYKVPQGTAMNADMYKDFLQNTLRPKIRKNRLGMLEKGVIILHNCRVHTVRVTIEVLTKYGWEILPHPAYSPDMSPCDYDLNPKLKESMRGTRFGNTQELIARLTQEIRRMNKEALLDGIQKLPTCWEKCIALQGDYIEGF